jgi:hypothetical protein
MYTLIVEVEKAANHQLPLLLPVIAVYDPSSSIDWISQSFINELENIVPKRSNLTRRGSHPVVNGDAGCILIEWSCEALGRFAEPRTFFVAPQAKFKIIFGSESRSARARSSVSCDCYDDILERRLEDGIYSAETYSLSFYQGIRNGTLVRLKRLLGDDKDKKSNISLQELEAWLQFVTQSFSQTEKLLLSSASLEKSVDPATPQMSYASAAFDAINIYDASSNVSSLFEDHDLDKENFGTASYIHAFPGFDTPFAVKKWIDQPAGADPFSPEPILFVQPRKRPAIKMRHVNQESNTRQESRSTAAKLADVKKLADEYWTWDPEKGAWKHYDKGQSEPEWYDPP